MIGKLKKIYDLVPVPSKKSSKEVAVWIFKQLNIEFTKEDVSDGVITYSFSFQDAFFHMSCFEGQPDVVVNFYYVFVEKYELRQGIAYLCNRLNREYHHATFFYSYGEDENDVSVHLKNTFTLTDTNLENKKVFTDKLGELFSLRRLFDDEFRGLRSSFEKSDRVDVLDELQMEKRAKYLLLEQEISNQHYPVIRTQFQHLVLTPNDIFTFSGKFLPQENVEKISFVYVHHFQEEIAKEDFASYNVAAKIRELRENLRQEGTGEKDRYILSVSCNDGSFYSANMIWQSESKTSDYYMLTINSPFVLKKSEVVTESEQPLNVVYVLDKSKSNNEAEAKYMIDDAIDKAKSGRYDELNDDQKVLVNFANWTIKEDLYWGYKYFNDKCYFQAIKHFECVLGAIHPVFDTLTKKQKTDILGVYFRTGFAYTELNVYSKALYYLDIPYCFGNLDGCMAYITCLLKAKDFRASDIIENQLSMITERLRDYDEEDEVPDSYMEYRNFLLRNRVIMLIDKKKYGHAEDMLNRMLKEDDEGLRIFAESELSYLKTLKEKEEKDEENKKE